MKAGRPTKGRSQLAPPPDDLNRVTEARDAVIRMRRHGGSWGRPGTVVAVLVRSWRGCGSIGTSVT